MPNHHTMLWQQKTFIPNRSLHSKQQEIGVPGEGEEDDSDMELILVLLVNKFLNLFVLER
jgi:hypothetical protein